MKQPFTEDWVRIPPQQCERLIKSHRKQILEELRIIGCS